MVEVGPRLEIQWKYLVVEEVLARYWPLACLWSPVCKGHHALTETVPVHSEVVTVWLLHIVVHSDPASLVRLYVQVWPGRCAIDNHRLSRLASHCHVLICYP